MTSSPTSSGGIYKRLLAYSLGYWPLLLLGVAGMAVSAASETGFVALMQPLLEGSFVNKDPAALKWVPVLLVLVFVARGVATFVVGYSMSYIGRGVIKHFRSSMFSRYLKLPAEYFDQVSSGELISKVTYDVEQLASIRRHCSVPLIASGGAGAINHFTNVFKQADVDGALAASVFHKNIIAMAELKQQLIDEGIAIRPIEQGVL